MPRVIVTSRSLPAALRKHFRQRQNELKAAAMDTAHRGVAEAVRLTNAAGLVDSGAYKRGFRVRRSRAGPEVRNDNPYAAVIEHGRRPMRPGPPYAPILAWVQSKLGMRGKAAERAAWAIRAAIHRRGTPPKHIMRRTYNRMRQWFRADVERRLRTGSTP
jgi:hypothetical protein